MVLIPTLCLLLVLGVFCQPAHAAELQFESFLTAVQPPASPKKVIIDTDMGWDDTLSILYLLKNPHVEIVGITVTGCGETNLRWGTTIALALMELGGRTDVPVSVGTETPLKFDHVFPQLFRNDMNDLMGLLGSLNPKARMQPDPRPAWQFLSETVNQAETPLTILSLGGFTNLARMLRDYPKTRTERIENIYAMAGAVFVDGNVAALNNARKEWNQGPLYASNTTAEWNVFVDPLAAKLVFDANIPLTLVPLDAADYVLLSADAVETITATDPLAHLAKRILEQKTGPHDEGIPVPIFDPLATMIMADGLTPYQYITGYFDVDQTESEQDNTCGRILPKTSGSRKIKVVQGVSSDGFAKAYAAVMNR